MFPTAFVILLCLAIGARSMMTEQCSRFREFGEKALNCMRITTKMTRKKYSCLWYILRITTSQLANRRALRENERFAKSR